MYFLFHPISSINHLVARLVTDQLSILISLVFFIVLSLNYKKTFWQKADSDVKRWSEESKNTFLKKHSEDFAFFGNAIFHVLFSVILSIIFFAVKHNTGEVFSILFVLVFSWGLNRLMKLIYKRERPEYSSGGVKRRLSYCFPSGHVMASISIYFFSALVLQNHISFIPWYLIALLISYFVIMSRIYLNHHYFTDVLGGIAAGIFCLNISIWFYFFLVIGQG